MTDIPNFAERIEGDTQGYVPHPGTNLNDPTDPELQSFLHNIGMDGMADPRTKDVANMVVGSEVRVFKKPTIADAEAATVEAIKAHNRGETTE